MSVGEKNIQNNTMNEEMIRQFDSYIKNELEMQCVSANANNDMLFESVKKIIVIRSGPIGMFERFLKKNYDRLKSIDEIIYIGKESDRDIVSKYMNCSLIHVDGAYTYENVIAACDELNALAPDMILFFSRTIPDANYENIYELVASLSDMYEKKIEVICSDFDGELTRIADVKLFMATFRLHLAMGEWYWNKMNTMATQLEEENENNLYENELYNRLYNSYKPVTLSNSKRTLYVRSCQTVIFKSFIMAGYMEKDNALLVGKNTDAELLESTGYGNCKILHIDGNYTMDNIKPYINEIEAYRPERIVYFSRSVSDGDYANIYKVIDGLNKVNMQEHANQLQIICFDFNLNCYEINDIHIFADTIDRMIEFANNECIGKEGALNG